jgi:hypothetical protein
MIVATPFVTSLDLLVSNADFAARPTPASAMRPKTKAMILASKLSIFQFLLG